jgi:uncharacterized membrane protein YtjA (UPF0391 family)
MDCGGGGFLRRADAFLGRCRCFFWTEGLWFSCLAAHLIPNQLRRVWRGISLALIGIIISLLKRKNMLRWTLIFLIIAIIAGAFGFFGIAAGAASIAKVLFFIFIVLFLVSFIMGRRSSV